MEDSQVLGPLQIPGQGAMNQPQQADAWFKRTTPSAGTLPPQAQPTCPPSPPQQSGRGQMDEAEAPSILSLAQLLAVSWVTVAHQYLRKYSSEGAPIRSCTADHGPARAGSVDRSLQGGGHASVGSGGGAGGGRLCCCSGTCRPLSHLQHLDLRSGRQKGAVCALHLLAPRPSPPPHPGGAESIEWCVVLWLSHLLTGGPCVRPPASPCQFPHQRNGNISASEGGCKAQTRFWSDCLSKGYENRALLQLCPEG